MAEFQPPPTWAPVGLSTKDPATGTPGMTFNPIWLKWFVDLTALLTADPNTGAVTGGQPAEGGQPGSGTVTGPASSGDGHYALFEGTTGTRLQDGGRVVQFADMEIPGDTVDGANVLFHLLHEPNPPQSLQLFHKLGNRVFIGFGEDYTLAAAGVITMTAPPAVGDYLIAFYRYFD